MTTIYNPAEKGFDDRLASIDRCQVALLREIAGQYGTRLTLKGGMAMRAVFGSMRLTKDIDFDRDQSLSLDSAKNGLPKALIRAAANAGIREAKSEITKLTSTTIRARLTGRSAQGVELRFEVEVSGRGSIAAGERRAVTVVPPPAYGIAPFLVEAYSNDMLAAMKIGAAMSAARNAPRDIYDLRDLIAAGADASKLLGTQPREVLQGLRQSVLGKLELTHFALAREELLPYLPQGVRDSMTEDSWIEDTLTVASTIEAWITQALNLQNAADEAHVDPVVITKLSEG